MQKLATVLCVLQHAQHNSKSVRQEGLHLHSKSAAQVGQKTSLAVSSPGSIQMPYNDSASNNDDDDEQNPHPATPTVHICQTVLKSWNPADS